MKQTFLKYFILFAPIFFSSQSFSQTLKEEVSDQTDFFLKNSYSCKFSVPDPLVHGQNISALVPLHIPFSCSDNPTENEKILSEHERFSTGDSVIHTGMMCRMGLEEFCDNVKNSLRIDVGSHYRSPILKPTAHYGGDAKDFFSTDQALGTLLYFVTTYHKVRSNPAELENLKKYARNFAKYINTFSPGYAFCPPSRDSLDVCLIVLPGEVSLFKDVYNYIGVNSAEDKKIFPYTGDILSSSKFFKAKSVVCVLQGGFECNLAALTYLIERDMGFPDGNQEAFNAERDRMLQKGVFANNPFQIFAFASRETDLDWGKLGEQTVTLCKNANNPSWLAGNRPHWLWEQQNNDLAGDTSISKSIWGWDCLAMLKMISTKL
jgi:hypothetical protein